MKSLADARRNSRAAAMISLEEEKPVFSSDTAALHQLVTKHGHQDGEWEVAVASSPQDPQLPGDCPHCHRVLMILLHKRIPFRLTILDPSNDSSAPAWVLKLPNQAPPLLRHAEAVTVGAEDISEYLEMTYPEPSLQPSEYEVLEVGEDLFGAFFRYLKNNRPGVEDMLRDRVVACLDEIQGQLATSGGPYLDGDRLTLADCNMWPKLHHALVALGQLKGFQVSDENILVLCYIGTMMETDVAEQTRYPEEWVKHRWMKYIKRSSSFAGDSQTTIA